MDDEYQVDELEYKGFDIAVYREENPRDPREDDNFGKMVCAHRSYRLGDAHDYTVDYIKKYVGRSDVLKLPLYLYDHSGITMRSRPFEGPDARWDSGMVGYIFISHSDLRKEMGYKRLSPKRITKAMDHLEAEVATYNYYIMGEVYGYEVEKDGERLDSCWGFHGDSADALNAAKEFVDNLK